MAKTYSYEEVRDIIYKNPNKDIVKKAQDMRKLYSKHTHSIGYKEDMKMDAYVENLDCFGSRKMSAISNRDLMKRILNKEDQVFTTSGGSAFFGLPKEQEKQMNGLIDDVIHGMNIYQWVHTYALPAYRSDPMGLVFMECEEVYSGDGVNFNTPKCYPAYKSSAEVYDYKPNGTNLDYICFSLTPKQIQEYGLIETAPINLPSFAVGNTTTGYYRFVDATTDTIYKQSGGDLIVVVMRQKNPLLHGFDQVPAFLISDLFQYDDPKVLGSPLQFIIELAEVFFNGRSVLELHKKLHGFPKAVEPLLSCPTCRQGGESTGLVRGISCPDCTLPGQSQGTGYKLKTTPADVARFPMEMLKEIAHFKVQDIFAYIGPAVEGIEMMVNSLVTSEELMYSTYWGTQPKKAVNFNGKQDTEKTATQTLTDLQPEYARLNMTANWAENTITRIANFIGYYWFDNWKPNQANINLSRNYILELPEDLLFVYHDMRKNGTPDVEMDNQFKRYLMALYKASPAKLAVSLKFYEMQPFPHKLDGVVEASPNISEYHKCAYANFGEWCRSLSDAQKQTLKKEQLQELFDTFISELLLQVKADAAEQALADATLKIQTSQN